MELPVSDAERAITATVRGLRRLRVAGPRHAGSRRPTPSNLAAFETAWRQSPVPIVGFGIAIKRTGTNADPVCVRVYVRRKLSKRRLGSLALLPSSAEFGVALPSLPLDVVEMPVNPQLQSSCSAGAEISALGGKGTLGALVVSALGVKFGLTCAHVVAPWSHPNPFATRVTVALPGVESTVTFGTVEAWTPFFSLGANTADAALIRLDPDISVDNALGPSAVLDNTPISDLDLLRGKSVRIRTRRGELTGLVDSVKNDLSFGFGGRDFPFSNILAYQASVLPGDSGASVVLGANRLVGLHFAGSGVGGTIGPGYCVTGRKILQAFPNHQLRLP